MFSVVIPVWNARATVARTVDSVLAQTFADFELIIVDDGSTDDGLATLGAPLDPRIVVLRQENAGEGAARNAGIARARHDWIALLDADDLWLPGHLAELDRVRRSFPEAGLIGTAYVATDATGGRAVPHDHGPARIELVAYFERFGRGPNPFFASSAALSTRTLDDVGGFGHHLNGTENELFARIALRHPVAASARRTAVYVVGTRGVTSRASDRWKGATLRSAADIAPAVATVLRHCAETGPEGEPPGVDAYVARYVGWCLASSLHIGDVDTARSLRRLYRRAPPLEHRALLALGRLPPPAARLGHRAVAGTGRRLRCSRRRGLRAARSACRRSGGRPPSTARRGTGGGR